MRRSVPTTTARRLLTTDCLAPYPPSKIADLRSHRIMNLIEQFQDLVAAVPELLQPLIVALAGAIPFVEGEGAAVIGVMGGINPVVAAIAAIIGNFLCVAVLVLLSVRTRNAVVAARGRSRQSQNGNASATLPVNAAGSEAAAATNFTAATDGTAIGTLDASGQASLDDAIAPSPRREKFVRALERYGVPGVSLLGPLLLPTQFTATMLAAIGVRPARILFWQGLAIVGWATVVTLLVTGVLVVAR